MTRLSVVVACTRPERVAALADALAAGAPEVDRELVVAGDVASLPTDGWPLPTLLVPCVDRHPNRRRQAALAIASAPVVAFLDDDAVPQPGWVAAAAALDPDGREIWTGPEQPPRDTPGSRLARSVASSLLAEGTRAHAASGDGVLAWFEVPFCNLVAPRRVLDELGPLPCHHAWDLDDFVVCRLAAERGMGFASRRALAITHDRYPDRPSAWLARKAAERRRTGQKLAHYPEVYGRLPGAMAAALAPWVLAVALAVAGRNRRVVPVAAALYVSALVGEAVRTGARGRDVLRVVGGTAALHAVTVPALQVGLASGLADRLAGRPDPWAPSPRPIVEEVPWPAPC